MLRSLRQRLARTLRFSPGGDDPAQLTLVFERPPRDGPELLVRLRALGLTRIATCELTANRRTMVSFRGGALRVHAGYLDAPEPVLRAIVAFVESRRRPDRDRARRAIIAYCAPRAVGATPVRRERTHPDDDLLALRLQADHAALNAERFGGALSTIAVRVSRRMKSRLGHYAPAGDGAPAEIAISRRHIRRHGWVDVRDTLVHEMVHQWQVETGRPLDHGPEFRRKAREVGAAPRATRRVDPG
ncbi:MAG TPA: SprT-like domain-containing protein [Gemmatimonadaceae bacterium]|nr:SprT-like domain-containing protein [Gemmatimonadaceae bacterium]